MVARMRRLAVKLCPLCPGSVLHTAAAALITPPPPPPPPRQPHPISRSSKLITSLWSQQCFDMISQLVSQRREGDVGHQGYDSIFIYTKYIYLYIYRPRLIPLHRIYQSSMRPELRENERGYLMR